MVKPKTARGLTSFIIICSAAGAFAGWSAYSTHWSEAALQGAYFEPTGSVEPLTSNKDAKGDRLGFATPRASDAPPLTMVLASVDPAVTAVPPSARAVPAIAAAVPAIAAAVPAVKLPPTKPKAVPTQASSGQFDESHIAQIRSRLRLTPDQEQYWPAVESALRAVLKQHSRDSRARGTHRVAANIDVNSPEVQRLTWAAMPLLMQLREDQKHEVRKFARTIGLDSVASQI